VGRDLFRLRQSKVGILIAALPGEQAGEIDKPSDLLGGKLHGPPQVGFGFGILLAIFRQPGLCPLPLGGADAGNLRGRGGRLVEPAAQEAWSLQVILEEIA